MKYLLHSNYEIILLMFRDESERVLYHVAVNDKPRTGPAYIEKTGYVLLEDAVRCGAELIISLIHGDSDLSTLRQVKSS